MKNTKIETKRWLDWATEIQGIAQIGRTYSKDPYDQERYEQLSSVAADIIASHSATEFSVIEDLLAKEIGYSTPKLDVRGVVLQNNKLLLVKECSDELWALPGGWADVNLSASESIIKEIEEEAGFQTKVIKLLAFWDKQKHDHPPEWPHAYKCFFHCEITGGSAKPSLETSAVEFFDFDELPDLSLPRITKSQLFTLRNLIKNDADTVFD